MRLKSTRGAIVELQKEENIENIDKLESLKKRLLYEKQSKVELQEELLGTYLEHENLLRAYQKMQSRYHAISNSKLGKLTYIYWKMSKRIKRGKKNANYED